VPEPLDFSAFLKEKLNRYTDRRWLFDEVDAWLVHSGERVLLLNGDMGVGKSTFLAELVRRNPGGRVLERFTVALRTSRPPRLALICRPFGAESDIRLGLCAPQS
jgi:hypothetical protein